MGQKIDYQQSHCRYLHCLGKPMPMITNQGFILEKGMAGLIAPEIAKFSGASKTGLIQMDEVFMPAENLLENIMV